MSKKKQRFAKEMNILDCNFVNSTKKRQTNLLKYRLLNCLITKRKNYVDYLCAFCLNTFKFIAMSLQTPKPQVNNSTGNYYYSGSPFLYYNATPSPKVRPPLWCFTWGHKAGLGSVNQWVASSERQLRIRIFVAVHRCRRWCVRERFRVYDHIGSSVIAMHLGQSVVRALLLKFWQRCRRPGRAPDR